MIKRLNEDIDGKTLLDKSVEFARRLYGYTGNYKMSSEDRMDLQADLVKLIAMIEGAQEYYLNVKKESKLRNKKRSIKESYEGSHTFGYIEPDGEFYQDIFGEFTVEEYYDEESDEILGWTWYCSDDFEPTEPYFLTAKEAYEDAKYVLTPDDGSELVIEEVKNRSKTNYESLRRNKSRYRK